MKCEAIVLVNRFEFEDAGGFTFGKDLLYDPGSVTWRGQQESSKRPPVKRSRENFPSLEETPMGCCSREENTEIALRTGINEGLCCCS